MPLGGLAACGDVPSPHPADSVLRESLGFTERDQVVRVEIRATDSAESVVPAVVRVPPGAWVQFVVADHRAHTVVFELDGLSVEQADHIRIEGQHASPPLVGLNTRFLVSFVDAPTGTYPFRVEGSGPSAEGMVVVDDSLR